MASTTQERLYEIFAAIAGEQTRFPERGPQPQATGDAITDEQLTDTAEIVIRESSRLVQLDSSTASAGRSAQPAQSRSGGSQQRVFGDSAAAFAASSFAGLLSPAGGVVDAVKQGFEGGGGVVKTLESIASTVFTSGFGLVSLFGGLFDLFGGGGPTTPPPLVKFALPPAISFQAAETASGIENADYDQMGQPRAYGGSTQSGGAGSIPTITVNVQALDARSFLDRSNEIAAAVRDAMLNLNSINDVINEL